MNIKYVVVGGGVAGVTALKEIRKLDMDSRVALIGDEGFYPYNRIRLSKSLIGSIDESKILLQKKDWYKENNIELFLSEGVSGIDVDNKQISLSDGKNINYDKLLIATGAYNFIPNFKGVDKEGVCSLRTLEDAEKINQYLEHYREIISIGGGIQGLEMAWIFRQMGKHVTLIERMDRIMPRQLDSKASEILKKAVEDKGISVKLNTEVVEFFGEERVEGVILGDDNEIKCDMVNIAIGIRPNTDFLKGSKVDTSKGVLIDEYMTTSIKDVYAAGDVVEVDNAILGLWNIAIEQGKVAGKNMAGEQVEYKKLIPVTTLNAFDISLFSMGNVQDEDASEVIVEIGYQDSTYNKLFFRDNKIIGAIVIGNIRTSPVLKKAIEKEIDLGDIDVNKITFDKVIEIIKSKK